MGEHVKLTPMEAYSYSGAPIEFLGPDTLVYQAGAGLHLRKLGGEEETVPFLWPRAEAVECFAVNPRRALLAYSTRIPSPPITVVGFPQGTDRATLSGGTKLGYCQMVFMRDGERLAALGHAREPRLVIWAVDTETRLVESMVSMAAARVSFNPTLRDMLATSGEGGLCVWRSSKVVESTFSLSATPLTLPSHPSTSLIGQKQASVTAHCWGLNNQLLCVTAWHELLVYSAENHELLQRIAGPSSPSMGPPSPTVALLLTQTHVLQATASGLVRWRSLKDLQRVERVVRLPPLPSPSPSPSSISERGDTLSALAVSPSFDKLVLGSSVGRLLDCGLEVPPVLMAQAASSGEEGGLSDDAASTLDAGLGEYHSGAVLCLANVCAGEEMFVTGGRDGGLRLWGAGGHDEEDEEERDRKAAAPHHVLGRGGMRGSGGGGGGPANRRGSAQGIKPAGAAGAGGHGSGNNGGAGGAGKGPLRLLLCRHFTADVPAPPPPPAPLALATTFTGGAAAQPTSTDLPEAAAANAAPPSENAEPPSAVAVETAEEKGGGGPTGALPLPSSTPAPSSSSPSMDGTSRGALTGTTEGKGEGKGNKAATVAVTVPLTALASMARQRVLAVGTARGLLSICYVEEEPVNLVPMYCQWVFRHAISHLAFSENDGHLAIASTCVGDGVHILACTHEAGAEHFRIIGIWHPIPHPSALTPSCPVASIAALAWQGTATLLFADSLGHMYACATSEGWASGDVAGEPLQPYWKAKIDLPCPVALLSLPAKSGVLVLSSTTNFLQTYRTPQPGEKVNDYAHLGVLASLPAHERTPLCMAMSPNGKFLATGAADGSVNLYNMGDGRSAPRRLDSQRLHRSGVLCVAFSRNSARLYSAGLEGDVLRLGVEGAEPERNTGMKSGFDKAKNQYKWQNINGTHMLPTLPVGAPPSAPVLLPHGKGEEAGTHAAPAGGRKTVASASAVRGVAEGGLSELRQTWVESALERVAARKALQHDTYKSLHRQKLMRLGEKLRGMLDANAAVAPLEKLDREEFVLNTETRDTQLQRNREQADKLRAEIQAQDLGRNLVRARIMSMCWDSMEVHGKEIRALSRDGVLVSNFPLCRVSESSVRRLHRVMMLRAMELRDIRMHTRKNQRAWPGLMNEVPHGITWIINEGFFRPTTDLQELHRRIQARTATQASAAAGGGGGGGGNNGSKTPTTQHMRSPRGEDDEEEGGGEGDDRAVAALLYPPGVIRTPNQKRTQMLLTLEYIRMVKKKFNEHFDGLFRAKEEEMERSEARNDRVAQILAELGSTETVARPTWSPGETPDKVLEVLPSEMTCTPYETEAMREVRRQAEEEARRRDEEARRDNIGERALSDMMFGTLEAKSDALASAQALERPKWMDATPPEQWSEEQKAEAEALEARRKKVAEEAEKKRKELELELKKLRTEIADAYKAFDDKVKELGDLKFLAQSVILQQELIVLRLAASLCHREDAAIENRRLEAKLRDLGEQSALLQHRISLFRTHYESAREEAERLQSDDRQLEKNFRKDLQDVSATPIDQDTLKILLQLYKSRPRNAAHGGRTSGTTMQGNGSTRGSSFGHTGTQRMPSHNRQSSSGQSKTAVGPDGVRRKSTSASDTRGTGVRRRSSQGGSSKGTPLAGGAEEAPGAGEDGSGALDRGRGWSKDPFYGVEEASERNRRTSLVPTTDIAPLHMETDCPDGFIVSEPVWTRLQELRVQKFLAENAVRRGLGVVSDVKRALDALLAQQEEIHATVSALQAKKFDTAETMAFKQRNTEVLVRLKQGQTEVEQEAVVTDYSDTLFIPVNNVNKVNAEVVRLGGDKVKMLHRIRDFRKSINLIAWEHRYLGRVAADLDEHYKDLQLTRVTRNLQELLNGDQLEKERQKVERGEARLGIMAKAHEDRVVKMKANNGLLVAKIHEKEDENASLERQLKDLRAAMEAREAIYRTRADGNGGNNASAQSAAKMKRITMRRRLVELARSQSDEIEFLKQELDRLRQRTFPSFAHAARARLANNPDEF